MRIVGATLPAHDPQSLADWYAQVLGRVPVAFEPGETSPQHLAFHVGELACWRSRLTVPLLRDRDGTEEFDFAAWGGARSIYCEDPEGNVVELVERPAPRPELSLAEIGLATADVAVAVNALERELGLRQFDGDQVRFAAVGDPDGLLIVVVVGRAWYPSRIPAGEAAVTVRIEDTGPGDLLLPGSRHRVVAV